MNNDPRGVWQNQEVEKMTITLDEVRNAAAKFERRILWRNVREYAAGALVIAYLTPFLWSGSREMKIPVLLMMAGALFVMWQLHVRASAARVPADAGLRASLEFRRRELERQRDALRSVWKWYLLPMVPGLAAVSIMRGMARGIDVGLIAMSLFFVLMLVGVWALNEWAARKLDLQIREAAEMEGKAS